MNSDTIHNSKHWGHNLKLNLQHWWVISVHANVISDDIGTNMVDDDVDISIRRVMSYDMWNTYSWTTNDILSWDEIILSHSPCFSYVIIYLWMKYNNIENNLKKKTIW